jgi:hypothetical protein
MGQARRITDSGQIEVGLYMFHEHSSDSARRLQIPGNVPEDFAHAVATLLILGTAGRDTWDRIYRHPPEKSLGWIERILKSNETSGLLHSDIRWWQHQVWGH